MMWMDQIRTFTLSEARSLIPRLRRLLAKVMSEREALLDLQAEIGRARDNAQFDGGSQYGPTYLSHLITFSRAVYAIESLGVKIKDFRAGLIDFPYEYDGRLVYLCWKPDEEQIGWWHEVDAGFAGRRPLTEDFQ